MPLLFGREWNVVVGAKIGAIRAGLRVNGHRCKFAIEKTLKAEPNTCSLSLWNLSREQRSQISELAPKVGESRGIPVLIEAGYKDTGAAQVWLGDLRTCTSERDGADWITTLESDDGGEAVKNARVNVNFGPGTTPDTALRAIVKSLGVDPGNLPIVIAKLRATGAAIFPKRVVLSGSAADHLTNFCKSADLEWSIQDGALQILDRGAVALGFAVLLSKVTGLVGSPSIDPKGVLTCRALLQPNVKPGALLVLDSLAVRGTFRITKVSWDCDTHGTEWYTDIEASRY